MIIKSLEGVSSSLISVLKKEIKSKLKYKIGSLFLKGAFKSIKKTMNYREASFGIVVGLNGLAIKAHGNSNEEAYYSTIKNMRKAIENKTIERLKNV